MTQQQEKLIDDKRLKARTKGDYKILLESYKGMVGGELLKESGRFERVEEVGFDGDGKKIPVFKDRFFFTVYCPDVDLAFEFNEKGKSTGKSWPVRRAS